MKTFQIILKIIAAPVAQEQVRELIYVWIDYPASAFYEEQQTFNKG